MTIKINTDINGLYNYYLYHTLYNAVVITILVLYSAIGIIIETDGITQRRRRRRTRGNRQCLQIRSIFNALQTHTHTRLFILEKFTTRNPLPMPIIVVTIIPVVELCTGRDGETRRKIKPILFGSFKPRHSPVFVLCWSQFNTIGWPSEGKTVFDYTTLYIISNHTKGWLAVRAEK